MVLAACESFLPFPATGYDRQTFMSRLQFGEHVIDLQARTLTYRGHRIALQRQPFELLELLINRAGQVVTREEIRARLWTDTVVEYDLSINYAIRRIRAALASDAAFIQTVSRQGYRFTAEVALINCHRTRPSMHFRVAAATALVIAAFVSGFGAGVLVRHEPAGQFVYDHLVHPDRCPYMRFLFPTHRNS